MDLELRAVTPEELGAFSRAVGTAFGERYTDQDVADWLPVAAGNSCFAVFDEGEVVATGGAFPFELTVPGGATVRASGLTAVGVRPTHRRRGLLNALMEHHLEEVAAAGWPLSVLTASESAIYGRYGYGSAAELAWWRLPTRGTTFASPSRAQGRLRLVDPTQAREVLPVVYEAHRAVTPGAVTRSAAMWDHLFLDREGDRDGASALFYAVHESPSGQPDGYATYRTRNVWGEHGLPTGEVIATSVISPDPEVEAALFELLVSIDLMATVRADARPLDDHLRWRLADPRRAQTTRVSDHLWVRVLDVAASLGARRYAGADSLVLEVSDPSRPANDGRWRLDAGPDGAACARTGEEADVALGIAELGATYLGGVRPSTLARAGRVQERSPGALARLDLLLAASPGPWCATDF